MRVAATQRVRAPRARAFEVFADVEHWAGRITGVKKVEVVSEVRSGEGTRWLETRRALTFGARPMSPMMTLFQGTMRTFMQKDLGDLSGFLERGG